MVNSQEEKLQSLFPRSTHSGKEGIFQGESPKQSHSLPNSSLLGKQLIEGEHPNSVFHMLWDARNCTCSELPAAVPLFILQTGTCELGEPTAMRCGSWQGRESQW